jgi:DNA-binding transcriptional LysR family regulator
MLNVKHIAVFRAVVRAGSISAAARQLHVSQPAITRTIRLLEESLGLPLFLRLGGRLQMTREAEELMSGVERLFGSVAAVEQMAAEIRDGFSGSISIATVPTIGSVLVTRAIERFHRQYPRVRFDMKSLPSRLVAEAVAKHHVDFGIMDSRHNGSNMEVIELCRSEMGCVARAAHPLSRLRQVGPADIAGETLISFDGETATGWQLRAAFQDAKVDAHVTMTINSTAAAYALVQAGVGLAIVDSFPMFSGAFDDLVIRPFRPLLQTKPHIAMSNSNPVPQIARTFIKVLKTITGELIADSRGILKKPEPVRKNAP